MQHDTFLTFRHTWSMRMGTAMGLWGVWKGGPFREGSMRIHAQGHNARPSCSSSAARSSRNFTSELPSRNDLQRKQVGLLTSDPAHQSWLRQELSLHIWTAQCEGCMLLAGLIRGSSRLSVLHRVQIILMCPVQ